jgi:hypothetical protein
MASMVGLMGAPRSRTPNEPGAREIAGALYPDLDGVAWIPSDDADVFRLSFTSGREPRILKMATHGIRAVWREIGAFPAMRRLGIPEVLAFEHTSDDLPDLGIEFHITRELAHPQQANRAMAELWINDRARALEVAHWLGDCTGRIESLNWRRVPRANSPQRSAEIGADWREPQYEQLLAPADCPAWARTFIDQVSGMLSRLDAFGSFGGWAGELLQARDGRFVLIDWPGLGAAPRGSQAAAALEILLRFGPRTRLPWSSGSWPAGPRRALTRAGSRTCACGGPTASRSGPGWTSAWALTPVSTSPASMQPPGTAWRMTIR